MSPWTIYWIFQLDNINGFFTAACKITGAFAAISLIGGAIFTDFGTDKYTDDAAEMWNRAKKLALQFGVSFVIFGTAQMFVPSTRTAAAMVVIPAIVNNETIRNEAGDLYTLAKQALRNSAAPEPERKK